MPVGCFVRVRFPGGKPNTSSTENLTSSAESIDDSQMTELSVSLLQPRE
jgi:hypothetical protein